MVRGNMLRWGWAVVGVAMSLAGCTCGEPQVDCTDTTISFETPTAGQTVDSPFEVTFSVKAPDGAAFAIDAATLKVGMQTLDATSVSGNRATFSGLTAVAGEVTLTPTIAEGSCSKTGAPISITVRDTCSTPQVTAVEFPQDVAPLGVLNRTELPDGTNLVVRVTASCVAEGVQVRVMRGGTVVGPLTAFVNGVATVTTTLPDSENSRYDLFAELVRDGQPVNTATSNPAAAASIQVSRSLPACALTTTGSFGPMADADSSTAGFQMRVTGTMAIGTTGSLGITGQTPVAVAPSMTGDVSADFTIPMSGSFTATLQCTDAAGNTNQATSMFSVDFDPPTVSITSPANVDGGATMQVTSSPLTVTVATNAEDGSLAEIFRNGTSVGTGTVQGGMVSLQVPFGSDGTYTVAVHVRDTAGNEGQASISVQVTLDGCGAIFSRPGACPALLTPAQLTSGTYSFQTTSKAACAAQPAQIFRADVLGDGGVGAEVSAGMSALNGTGQANFQPLTLASGEYLFRGVVTNPGEDAGVSQATCRVTVDLDGPVITNPVVPTNSTFAVINAAQDTQSGTPGAQRQLVFSARVPVGGQVDVCTTQATNPYATGADGGLAMRPTSNDCGAGWYLLQQGVTSGSTGFTFPDGQYDIKVVVVGGGLAVPPSSPPVRVLVDSVRPCVNGLSRSLPQDANGDGRLSIAELAGGQPQLSFQLGCGDTSASTLAASGAVVVRDIVSGAAGPVRPSTATFANGAYTVTLTGSYTTESDLNLFVELTDVAANRNLLAAMNDSASFSLRVDPVAPSCTITAPTATLLGIAQVPTSALDVIVATTADVGPNGVRVTFTGEAARQITPSLNQAQTTYALTGDSTYTIGATCTDQAGNATTATPRTTRVDLVAPTCNITAPANGATSSVNDVTTTVAVTGLADNDTVSVNSTVAGISNNQLTVAGTSASRLVRYSNGTQTITVSAFDAAGNACVAPPGGSLTAQLTVNSSTCSLDFAAGGTVITNLNGSWVNRISSGNTAGASPFSVTVGGVTSDCGAGRNVYLYPGVPVQPPTGTPQVTNALGAVSFSGVSVSEGQQWTMTIDNGAGIYTDRTFTVSFAQPSIGSIAIQRSATNAASIVVAPNASLTFGAASGNRRVDTATATDMVFGDLDGVAPNAQFQLVLTDINGARDGLPSASLEIFEGSTLLTPAISISATPFTPSLPRMSLAHRTDESTTSLVIRVTSPAGNVFSSTHAAQVDVVAPAAPAVTQTLTSARQGTVDLSWAPTYDDGSTAASGGLTGGTQAAGYDVRWTTSSVPSNNSMAAEADYFGGSSRQDAVVAWSASNISHTLTLPPLNTYFIGVRARDEVGNYSVYAAPSSLQNGWTQVVISNPSAEGTPSTHLFGQHVIGGASLNGDTVADLVVAAPNRGAGTTIGSVYVYWSGANADTATCALPACQELRPYDNAAGLFGTDISMSGNVGDVATEAKPDLVVAQPTFGSTVGRAFLYFGTTATSLNGTNFVEFRGTTGSNFASAARIISDIDGDGRDEIAVSAHGELSGQGRLYIFRGRSADPAFNAGVPGANWFNSRTSMDGSGNLFIPSSAATWIIEGPTPVDTGGNQFARLRWGLISLGDITGDSRNDFLVPMSKDNANNNRVQLYSGAVVAGAAAPLPSTAALQTILSPTPRTDSTTIDGFGRSALAGPITGSALPDLVVAYPRAARIHGYADLTSTGFASGTPTFTIQGAAGSPLTNFGSHLSSCDLNGDARRDLVAAEVLASGGRSWVLWQTAAGFEPAVDRVAPAFWVSEFSSVVANTRFGRMSACVDADGNSSSDLVVGDEGLGKVHIYR